MRSLRYWIGSKRVKLADRLAQRRAPSGPPHGERRALAAGPFSFPTHGATAGDLIACDVVCKMAQRSRTGVRRRFRATVQRRLRLATGRSRDYSHVVWICGPLGRSTEAFSRLRRRFASEDPEMDRGGPSR